MKNGAFKPYEELNYIFLLLCRTRYMQQMRYFCVCDMDDCIVIAVYKTLLIS